MRCAECGRDNPEGVEFCLNCGSMLPPTQDSSEDKDNGKEQEGKRGVERSEGPPERPPAGAAGPHNRNSSISKGWKLVVVILVLMIVFLTSTTILYYVRANRKASRIDSLAERNEELADENTSLLLALDSIETISRKTAQVIEKYVGKEDQDKPGWQDYLIDAMETIEDLSRAYQEVLESGEGGESFIDKIEKLVDEFLELESD